MTTRAAVASEALRFNGYEDGAGYDSPNQFSADLGRPTESWCGDYVTDVYKRIGLRLPSMQGGCSTGFAYVPSAVSAARARGAFVRSWQARVADLVCFDWNGDGLADHTELVTSYSGGVLYTIGGNSGPSDVDHFVGQGGVHRHAWNAPTNVGNRLILGVVAIEHFVTFSSTAPPPSSTCPYRLLMLKSPLMNGSDVRSVQEALNAHGASLTADGYYGPLTEAAVVNFQRRESIVADGVVGCVTRAKLGLPS